MNGNPLARPPASPPVIRLKTAAKELGMGLPPDHFGSDLDATLAMACSPQAKIVIVEVARWTIDLPVNDQFINTTFGDVINVWGTANALPPDGVTYASNTLDVPGQLPSDTILRGLSVRILTEPEMRTIDGNVYLPPGTSTVTPGSPDVFTLLDVANGALGLPAGATAPIPGAILYGLPTWRAAYALMNGYELEWSKNHQDSLLKEPLTQCATIEPFSEAEAAGLAFVNDWIAISEDNTLYRFLLTQQGLPVTVFLPISHERVGVFNAPAAPIGDFAPTREKESSPTIVGSIGVPQGRHEQDPYFFSTPIYWPAGHTMGIKFRVNDPAWQKQFQRWLSITGGSGGTAGADLALPFDTVLTPTIPSTIAAGVMNELSEDAVPVGVEGQVTGVRSLRKAGKLVFEIGLIGQRIPASWMPVVARAVASGSIQAPAGYGTLAGYMPKAS